MYFKQFLHNEMQTREDDDRNSYLSIVVELARGAEDSEDRLRVIAASVVEHLRRLNSQFANYVPRDRQLPWVEPADR